MKLTEAVIEVTTRGMAKAQAELNKVNNSMRTLAGEGRRLTESLRTPQERLTVETARYQQLLRKGAIDQTTYGRAMKRANEEYRKSLGETLNVQQRIQQAGAVAARGFLVGTAAIGGFLRMASPASVDQFTIAIGKVAIQVGRFFVPLIREATTWVNRLSDWLKSLSDDTREQVLHWVKVTGAVLGATVAFSRIFAIFSSGFGMLGAVAGLVIGLVSGIDTGSGSFDAFRGYLERAWAALQPLVEALGNFGSAVLPLLVSALTPLIEGFLTLAEFVLPILATVLNSLDSDWMAIIGSMLLAVVVVPKIVGLFSGLVGAFSSVVGGIKSMASAMTAFLANPWIAGIMLIAAAVAALVMSMRSVSESVDEVGRALDRAEEMAERLRAGGRLSRRDLSEALTPEDARAVLSAGSATERRGLATTRLAAMEAERRRRFGDATTETAMASETRSTRALTDTRDLSTVAGTDARAAEVRRRMGDTGFTPTRGDAVAMARGEDVREFMRVEALRSAGVDAATIDRMRATGSLGDTSLTEERVRDLSRTTGEGADMRRMDRSIEAMRAVAEGRTGLAGDESDRFRGEVRAPQVQIGSILDAWKKLQTSGTEDPATALAREALAESRGTHREVAALRSELSELRRGIVGIVP